MARKLSALALVLVAAATLLHGSAAQTRYVVGDALGWTIPPNGASTYSTWASNKTFNVGDNLVFNFTNGQHNVAKVTKAAFDACNTASPISTVTASPATIALNETGSHYYICTFGTHCSLGQKLAVTVSRASSPSPSPSPSPQPSTPPTASPVPAPAPGPEAATPSPASAPAPAPSTGPVTYTVGDTMGWAVPQSGASAYTTWASGKAFKVGDILVFNFAVNAHDVAVVTKANYDSCNRTSPLALYSTPPVRVTLNTSGQHYFLCAFTGHCSAGQKLAINVTGSSTATPPSPTASSPAPATPPSTATPPPAASSPNSPPPPTTPSSPSPSSATSPPSSGASALGVAGFSATLLSIAAALLY